MGARGLPPWHLWGNSQNITVPVTLAGGANFITGQLAKVSYRRPDSWRFMFFTKWLTTDAGLGATAFNVNILFDVFCGVGRSTINIPGFELYNLNNATAGPGSILFSGSIQGPLRNPTSVAGDNPITTLVAQDIQITTRLQAFVTGGVPPVGVQNVTFEVAALLAPEQHIRPDWYEEPPNFAGDETGGT